MTSSREPRDSNDPYALTRFVRRRMPRLPEGAEALRGVEGRSATEIFGSPDDLKLRSCAILFACVSPQDSVFHRLLAKYYRGEPDGRTLQ